MRTANVILHPNTWLVLPTWRYYYYCTTFLFVASGFILHFLGQDVKLCFCFHMRDVFLTRGGGGAERWDHWHISTRSRWTEMDRQIISLLTLKPPMRWSLLNSLPFLYHFRVGIGLPLAWHRNLTVLLAGTAWSFFSIFSGWAHCGAIAKQTTKKRTVSRWRHISRDSWHDALSTLWWWRGLWISSWSARR